jgi:hypothetical protein
LELSTGCYQGSPPLPDLAAAPLPRSSPASPPPERRAAVAGARTAAAGRCTLAVGAWWRPWRLGPPSHPPTVDPRPWQPDSATEEWIRWWRLSVFSLVSFFCVCFSFFPLKFEDSSCCYGRCGSMVVLLGG